MSPVRVAWPDGFERIPREDWAEAPVETLAVKYDTVENHGWYTNLDPTVEDVARFAREGSVLVDYSGGTGIFIDRLLRAHPEARFGIVNADSSPKFLRLSLEKFRDDPRVAFRLIRFLKPERRLQLLEEVLGPELVERGVDGIASTNAVHLYHDLEATFASWARSLRPGGRVFVQSGNIPLPEGDGKGWIIDDTVRAVDREARAIAREGREFAAYRDVLDDAERLAKYDALRDRVFLPPRPLRAYLDAMEGGGLRVLAVDHRPVRVRTEEWFDFLAVYHEAILGWAGGAEKVDGRAAIGPVLRDRMELMRHALARVFRGAPEFTAVWTYVTAERPA